MLSRRNFFESILATICILIHKLFASQFILRIANLVLLIISMNMLWQFIISMRTDLYLIILNHLGVASLHSASLKKLKNILRKGESEKMTVYNKAYVITWVVCGIFFVIYYVYGFRVYVQLGMNMYRSLVSNNVNYSDTFFLIVFVLVSVTCWVIGFMNKVREKNENWIIYV